MFFGRLDIEEKVMLMQQKEKIKIWRADERNFGSKKDVLAIVLS
jgi:hypothetical protein